MTTRILRAAAAALLLLTLGATAVLAGGWATIVADDAAPPVPRAGEDVEYGFTVLQHGVTPAGFEDPTLRLTNTITGETFDVPAEGPCSRRRPPRTRCSAWWPSPCSVSRWRASPSPGSVGGVRPWPPMAEP